MSPADDSAALARLINALRPYRGDLVLIGGWAHRLSRLHPLAQPVDFPPLFTQDVDLAIATGVRPGEEEDLRRLLLEAGFTERFLGEHQPPVTHYQLEDEGAFYVEFVAPLIGRPGSPTSTVAGVTAQRLRYLDILLIAPNRSALLRAAQRGPVPGPARRRDTPGPVGERGVPAIRRGGASPAEVTTGCRLEPQPARHPQTRTVDRRGRDPAAAPAADEARWG